jgi:hypothetical protein
MGKQALFRCVFVIADALKKPLNPTLQPTSLPTVRGTWLFFARSVTPAIERSA